MKENLAVLWIRYKSTVILSLFGNQIALLFFRISPDAAIIFYQYIKCCEGRVSSWLPSQMVEESPVTFAVTESCVFSTKVQNRLVSGMEQSLCLCSGQLNISYGTPDLATFSMLHCIFCSDKTLPDWPFCLHPQQRIAKAKAHQDPCCQAERAPAFSRQRLRYAITACCKTPGREYPCSLDQNVYLSKADSQECHLILCISIVLM